MAKSTDRKILELDGARVWFDEREGLQISLKDAELDREMKMAVNSPALSDALMELLRKHDLIHSQLHTREIDFFDRIPWQQAMDAAVPEHLRGAQVASETTSAMGDEDRLSITTWVFPDRSTDLTWMDYQQHADAFADQLRQRGHQIATLAVSAVGRFDDDGKEVVGTVGDQYFRVWSRSRQPRWTTQHEWALESYARTVVVPLLIKLGCGQPVLAWVGWLTKPYGNVHVMEIRLAGIDAERLLDDGVLSQLRDSLGVQWVRLIEKHDRGGLISYSLAIGDDWRDKDMSRLWINPMSRTKRRMDLAEYGQCDGLRGVQVRDSDWWR